ncbi:hypothetical protein, partial [Pseudomonas koreensis]|uniref:hypothetical protein n=1 Tax=Pseudomonas koreensis TaxID=198620 RepID=UPI001E4FB4C4
FAFCLADQKIAAFGSSLGAVRQCRREKTIETSRASRLSRPMYRPADVSPGRLHVSVTGEERNDDDSGRFSG